MNGHRTDPGGGFVLPASSTDIDNSPLINIGPILLSPKYNFYDQFLHNLRGRQPHIDLRIFGYDWRLSNSYTAKKLGTFIAEEWQLDKPPSDENERVTIIAHSMGGLVARYFIESSELEGFQWVKRLVTVGTPHLGAPVTYTYMLGTASVWPITDSLLHPESIRKLALRFDSLAEMLPVYDFVLLDQGGLERWQSTLSELLLYRHPAEGRAGSPMYVSALPVVMAFRSALVPPARLQAWLAWRRVQYVLLGGLGKETTSFVRRGKPVLSRDGDHTVPYRSAMNFGVPTKRTPRSEQFARSTLRIGMKRHPPLRNTFWFQRTAFDTDRRFKDTLRNDEGLEHDNAMNIESVGADIAWRLSLVNDEFLRYSPTLWMSHLWSVGQGIAQTLRRDLRPQVLCIARIRLHPSQQGSEPPLPYAISHCGEGHRAAFPAAGWQETLECLEDRWEQTFPDVVAGLALRRLSYEGRFVLMDRQAETDSYHPSGGAILIDEPSSANDIFVVTWNTGEMSPARNRGNSHHAEAHLIGWWLKQVELQHKDWQDRLSELEVLVEMSPCTDCCADLRLIAGKRWSDVEQPPNLREARISWHGLYPGAKDGTNATKASDLAALEGGKPGWSIIEDNVIFTVPFRSPRPARKTNAAKQRT